MLPSVIVLPHSWPSHGDLVAAPLVLASRSPRRRELLGSIFDGVRVLPPPDAAEDPLDDLADERDLQRRLKATVARKAEQVAALLAEDAGDLPTTTEPWLVAADTTVVIEGPQTADGRRPPRSLGQPRDEEEAAHFLRRLSRSTHRVMTAVQLQRSGRRQTAIATTTVTFHDLSADRIAWYVGTGEPVGKAGGYAIQGLGSLLVERVEGSLSNVIGLPLELFTRKAGRA